MSVPTVSTPEEALAALGITPPDTEDEGTATDAPSTTEDTATDPASESSEASSTEDTPPAAAAKPAPAPEIDKSARAFAQMRVQNANMSKLLKGIGAVLGLSEQEINDEKRLTEALQAKILAQEAERQNVPVELLARLKYLEERDQHFTALQRQQAAALGFQAVKDQFGLTQEQLNEFAAELVQNGINPLTTDNVDLVAQYRILHHEDLVKAAVEKALAEERARAAKATSSAPTPGKTTGVGGVKDPGKVESVHDLERFLAANIN